jgi:hypothetical protein
MNIPPVIAPIARKAKGWLDHRERKLKVGSTFISRPIQKAIGVEPSRALLEGQSQSLFDVIFLVLF